MDEMQEPESTLSELKMGSEKPDQMKDWKELHEHEQIERLHRVVKQQERVIRSLIDYTSRLIGHEHLNGKMVQPVGRPGSEGCVGFFYRKRSDEWF